VIDLARLGRPEFLDRRVGEAPLPAH
jgi:hypothetical protein